MAGHNHVRDGAPPANRQQRKSERVVDVHEDELRHGRNYEARTEIARMTRNMMTMSGVLFLNNAVSAPPDDAAQGRKGDGQQAEDGRNREVFADDVVDQAILLGEGNAEVALQQIAEKDPVLCGEGVGRVRTWLPGWRVRRRRVLCR